MLNCPRCRQSLTPHEIGVLHAAVGRMQNRTSPRFWGAKLTRQEVNLIRKSKKTIKEIAEKYKVSFTTIWKIKENLTYKGQDGLNCPHCGDELTSKEIGRLFGRLGGSISSPKKARTAVTNGRRVSKLTEKDVANIRRSKASTKELARKYKVAYATIFQIRANERWKSTSSG